MLRIAVTLAFTLFTGAVATQTVDKQACQKAYSDTVAACAKNLSFLEPITRAGAQKACVQSAKLARDACLAGGPSSACIDSCQTVYNNSVVACEVTFNPADCGGAYTCERIVTQQRADCVSQAVTALDACTAACSTP
jgi:hypothetical protein